MELNELLKKLRAKERFSCGAAASEESIARCELALNLKFPFSYRNFLSSVSFARWFGASIFGISNEPALDVCRQTALARSRDVPLGFKLFPANAIVLRRYGGGGFYVLFCANSDRQGEVALMVDEEDFDEVDHWDTLESYLETLVS